MNKKVFLLFAILLIIVLIECSRLDNSGKNDKDGGRTSSSSSSSLNNSSSSSSSSNSSSSSSTPNITTIIGKWRSLYNLNDSLGTEKNSIYIFNSDNSGIHVTYYLKDGTGNLSSFNWQTLESGINNILELKYSYETVDYNYYFKGNTMFFDGFAEVYTNIYSGNLDINNYNKEIEPNNITDTSNEIPVDGTPFYGEIKPGDVDCYKFTGKGGYYYYVNVDYLTGDNSNLCINWYKYAFYSSGGYYYWDNFTAVNNNGINLGEYDNLRLSGIGSSTFSIRISDINNNGCTYLISVFEEKKE